LKAENAGIYLLRQMPGLGKMIAAACPVQLEEGRAKAEAA